MNFNLLFKTTSWQSILAADVHAAIKRGMEASGEERRINLIDYEATVEHVLMSIGPHRTGERPGKKHLISGASARLTLRAAPDIQLNAGVSNFWQKRHGSQPQAPDALATLARQRAYKEDPRDA
jgi:hypothetical protein